MANPDPYTRGYGFANYQSSNPTSPLPGNRVDVELDDISDSLGQTQAALQDVRRSDGALKNGIVTPESFSTASLALMQDWNFRGEWTALTAYAANDVVSRAGATYVVPSAYTSSASFDTDLSNGDLLLFANPPGALGQILFASFNGDGTTVSFNVGVMLTDPKQVQVFVDSGIVSPEAYNVSGSNVVLGAAPPVGVGNVLVFGSDLVGVTYAAEAAASAAAAAVSATAAETAETNAGIAESNAGAAEVGAEAALASFSEKYLGAFADDTAANAAAGGTPVNGAIYWNTANTTLRVYDTGTTAWYTNPGDVAGPASATNDALARFDGTTGKLLKNGPSVGVSVNGIVQFSDDGGGNAQYPAANGSLITNLKAAVVGAARNLVGAYATAATATYTADELVMKNSAGAAYVASNVSFTVNITASGVNGLDAGLEAPDTWYYIHAIYNGTSTNGLISTSATAPTLPSGYTYSALIGVIRNDSSGDFFPFLQNDRNISVQPHSVFAGVAGVSSFTPVSISSQVPPIAKSCDGWFGHASINVTSGVRVASDTAGLGAQALAAQSSGVVYDGYAIRMTFIDLKCPSQTIYWASVNVGTATHAMAIVGYQI